MAKVPPPIMKLAMTVSPTPALPRKRERENTPLRVAAYFFAVSPIGTTFSGEA